MHGYCHTFLAGVDMQHGCVLFPSEPKAGSDKELVMILDIIVRAQLRIPIQVVLHGESQFGAESGAEKALADPGVSAFKVGIELVCPVKRRGKPEPQWQTLDGGKAA